VQLSDNYFDLLPGETVEITASSKASLDALKAQLKAVSLTDAFSADNKPASVSAAK
jgi:beta-mannosidase